MKKTMLAVVALALMLGACAQPKNYKVMCLQGYQFKYYTSQSIRAVVEPIYKNGKPLPCDNYRDLRMISPKEVQLLKITADNLFEDCVNRYYYNEIH